MDVVIITPEPGKTVEIGKRLLELADHPHDVQWVTWPAPGGFSVPLNLFRKFDGDDEEETEAPAKRRRGRPRKEESTDNNTSEEE